MSRQSDDAKLARLLRTHAPVAPEAPTELEERIVAAIREPEVLRIDVPMPARVRKGRRVMPWAALGTLAAGIGLYVAAGRIAAPAPAVPEGEIEQFVESSWDGTFGEGEGLDMQDTLADLDN
jgi:hypothetical protein